MCLAYSKKELITINYIFKMKTMYKIFKRVNTLKSVVLDNQIISNYIDKTILYRNYCNYVYYLKTALYMLPSITWSTATLELISSQTMFHQWLKYQLQWAPSCPQGYKEKRYKHELLDKFPIRSD